MLFLFLVPFLTTIFFLLSNYVFSCTSLILDSSPLFLFSLPLFLLHIDRFRTRSFCFIPPDGITIHQWNMTSYRYFGRLIYRAVVPSNWSVFFFPFSFRSVDGDAFIVFIVIHVKKIIFNNSNLNYHRYWLEKEKKN